MFKDLEPDGRPSVVFITVDMVPPDVYRPQETNGGLVHTPNLDRLRAEGVTFTNAFSNSPLCGPSRASYLTGRYPYVLVNEERAHEGWAVELRHDDIIFPEYLKAVGYLTKHVGKSHVGTAKFTDAFGEADAPWNRWAPPMTDDDGYVTHLRRLGVSAPVHRKPVQGLRVDRQSPGNIYGGFVTQADGSPFPEEATYPHYLAALAVERLDAAVEQGVRDGAPLYLQVDFFAPHQPFMVPDGYEGRAEALRRQVKVPESFYEVQKHDFRRLPGEPVIYETYRRSIGLYAEETLREYITTNFLQMEVLDRAIGKVLEALRERGLYDDALILFCADHGEMNGERALVDKGVYGHPRVARVPFVVRLPGGERAGAEVDTPICLLDVAPTLLETAGVEPGARLDGVSLWPLLSYTTRMGGRAPAGPAPGCAPALPNGSAPGGLAQGSARALPNGCAPALPNGSAPALPNGCAPAGLARPGDAVLADMDDRVFIFEACWHVAPNPAVALQWRKSPSEHYFYTYNLTSEYDELYDLTDTTYRNLAAEPDYENVKQQMLLRLADFLKADPRWRCYWHTLRLAKAEHLPPEPGDLQMFHPE